MRKPFLLSTLALLAACGGEPPQPALPAPTATTAATATAPASATATAAPAPAAKVVKRVVVSLTRKSGAQITTTLPDGTLTVTLDVLLNGRGPHIDAKITLAPDGTLASYEAKGHRTMGTTIDETFSRQGARARWKSIEEQGAKDVAAPAFYLPMGDVPETQGLLVQALIKAGGTLDLLPAGTARLEKDGETTVRAGDRDLKLIGYSITGIDLTPTHVWMNEDGSSFGITSEWLSIVPEGMESVIDPLIARQNQLDRARDARLARELSHKPPAAGLALTHARVLDVEHGKWLAEQTVLIAGDTIQSVGPSKSAKVPAGAEIVDLTGKAVLPGLWDMHAHLGDADGALNLASGVTTARDVGNDPDKLDDYKKRYDSGEAVGPRVLRFGFIEGRNEKAASSKVTAETPDEAKAAVDYYAKRHYEGIKIYNSVKPDLVPLLAKEAHARGMMVTGHIPVHMLAHEAVAAGYDGIEHINMLFLNFFATHDTDTRDTTRFTLVGDKAPGLDLKSKPVADFIKLLKDKKTVIDPTADAFEDLFVGEQGKIIAGLEGIADRLPVQLRRSFLTGGLPNEGKKEQYRAAYDKLLAMIKALFDAKVPLVIGTDTLAGLMLHHEMALFVRAGIPAADVLRMASLGAAQAMKMDKTTGSIAAGKAADLFVVDGDPLARIADAGRVITTVRGGVVFASAPLYTAVGVRP